VAAILAWPVLGITVRGLQWWLGGEEAFGERERRLLGVLFLLAFGLRFVGALSPRFFAHDALFHVHRLEAIEQGQLFFEHVSLEWGMRNDPYPGVYYLLLVPLHLLYRNAEALLAFVTSWLDGASVLAVWYLARSLAGKRAAIWAAWLYAFMPIGLAANWAGVYTNLFGYDFLLLVTAALVAAWRRQGNLSAVRWVPVWVVHFLSHFGTVVLGVPWLLTWVGLLYAPANRGQRRWLRRLLLLWAFALGLAVLLYYSFFLGVMLHGARSVFAEKAGELAAPDATLPTRWAALQVWWRWGAVVDFGGLGLFLGILGWLVMPRRRAGEAAGAWLVASVAVALPFWVISRVLFLSVRTMLFILPAVSIGCGLLLSRIARRGSVGRVVAVVVASYICLLGISIWLGVCFAGMRPPHVY
ncbi:MAG: hypothetical protein ACP5SI_10865, partial [Chloroflexia bacterium]